MHNFLFSQNEEMSKNTPSKYPKWKLSSQMESGCIC